MSEGNTGYIGGALYDLESERCRAFQRTNFAYIIATKAGASLLIMKIKSLMNKLDDQDADAIQTAMKFPCSVQPSNANLKTIREALDLKA